jgi:hypothetical protein
LWRWEFSLKEQHDYHDKARTKHTSQEEAMSQKEAGHTSQEEAGRSMRQAGAST